MATEYTGPSAREMIANRTLAKDFMARNSDPELVLDADELSLLKQFVNDPSRSNAILESRGLLADPKTSGSLVAYVMSLHDTERPALSTEDISTLKEWFASNTGEKA
ncbi:hypothetical protein LX36DRAFT_653442 [Colletotrichum falcatum]|nr:hypothetical protein LX36DRAFT_653442 [Colletotrichum falcatum]